MGERHFKLNALGGEGLGTGAAQGFGRVQQGLPTLRLSAQKVLRTLQPGEVGKLVAKVGDGFVNHALCVGQGKLGALVQRGLQGFFGLRAAMLKHHGLEVSLEASVQFALGHQCRIKTPPHQRLGRCVVFEQLVVGRQLHGLQRGQRRTAQQGGKPAVKGANLHLAPALQHVLIQI